MVMLLEGRHLQFFVYKKLDPPSYILYNSPYIIDVHETSIGYYINLFMYTVEPAMSSHPWDTGKVVF